MKVIFALFFLFNLGWSIFVFGFPPPNENTEKKPALILRDSYGRPISDSRKLKTEPPEKTFGLSDSVFGSFFNLEADKKYHLSIMRDGKEISNLSLRSDKIGVISTFALWWNLGFNYDTNDGQKGIDPDFAKHSYNLSMKDDNNNPVLETKIPVSNSPVKAFIYTCDKEGNPKNTFIRDKDDVYLSGQNLKEIVKGKNDEQDAKLYIYVVKDRWSWRIGDKLDDKDFLKQKYVETLSGGALGSPHMIWPGDDLEVGSYDIIVSHRNLGILLNKDVIDSNYGVGFKVIEEQPGEKKDIIRELACQAPPHISMFGNLDQPHRVIYKDYFSPIEEVWVAVETLNPTPAQREAQKVRIYVITHNNNKEWQDGEPLHDDSGGYEEVLLQPESAHAVFTRVWCKPGIREQGYDVVIDFKNSNGQFGTYDKGLDILDSGEKGGFYVPKKWVCLDSVSYNFTRNSIGDDAITIRLNLDTDVRVPEWQRGKRAFPAAYVKNSRVAVRPGFIAWCKDTTSADNYIYNATLKAYAVSGNLGDIKENQTFFNNQKSSPNRYFQVVKNTPDKIQSFYQEWEWYLLSINDGAKNENIHIGTSINRIYIVLDVPQQPWTIEGKTAPWADIVDLSSQVAFGENTPEAAAQKITQFLYEEIGALYEKVADYSGEIGGVKNNFQLTEFKKRIPNVGPVNCYDMGKALVTFGNVLGCNLTLRYCESFGNLNCIKSTGNNWNCQMYFSNHAFASIADNVFDASLKVNSWGKPDQKSYRAAWMIDVPWCNYKEMVLKKGEPQPPYPQIAIFNISIKE
jgi:hypothetical protein